VEDELSPAEQRRGGVIRNILDADPQQPAYPDFNLQNLMPEPRKLYEPNVRRAPGR